MYIVVPKINGLPSSSLLHESFRNRQEQQQLERCFEYNSCIFHTFIKLDKGVTNGQSKVSKCNTKEGY